LILLSLVILAPFALFASACSDGGSAGAGEITVYTALEDEQVTEYLAVFNEQYPDIKLNIVRESTGIITARLLAEKDNPIADVVWGTAASSLLVLVLQQVGIHVAADLVAGHHHQVGLLGVQHGVEQDLECPVSLEAQPGVAGSV